MELEDAPATEPQEQSVHGSHWDKLIVRMQAYRESVGNPSYRVLAERVAEARVARGVDPYAARVGKTTVYDCFQTGRPRANVDLLREVAQALGATSAEVDEWVDSCHKPLPAPPEVRAVETTPPATFRQALLLMVACLGLNLLGREVVDLLTLPIYLDMVGTALAALALGAWWGTGVGIATNLIGALTSGRVSIPFVLVNMTGALVWGYGLRRYAMGRTLPRYFMLNLLEAWACSVVAIPILIMLFGQDFRDGHDMVTTAVKNVVPNLWVATGMSNFITSTWDKLISGFIALVALVALPAAFRRDFPLAIGLHQLGSTAQDSTQA